MPQPSGPVALVIAGILFDDRITHGGNPIRANLISFLSSVAEAAEQSGWDLDRLEKAAAYPIDQLMDSGNDEDLYENDNATNSFFARSVLGCAKVLPELMQVMLQGLSDSDFRVRMCAAMGATTLSKNLSLSHYSSELVELFASRASSHENPDERCAYVLALGDLNACPDSFLTDSVPRVRLCAALAPALKDDRRAISELLTAMKDHIAEIDQWFIDRPPQFAIYPRFYVIARLVQAVRDFDTLQQAAESALLVASRFSVDHDWGSLLAAAFADGSGVVKTDSQRRFLRVWRAFVACLA